MKTLLSQVFPDDPLLSDLLSIHGAWEYLTTHPQLPTLRLTSLRQYASQRRIHVYTIDHCKALFTTRLALHHFFKQPDSIIMAETPHQTNPRLSQLLSVRGAWLYIQQRRPQKHFTFGTIQQYMSHRSMPVYTITGTDLLFTTALDIDAFLKYHYD